MEKTIPEKISERLNKIDIKSILEFLDFTVEEANGAKVRPSANFICDKILENRDFKLLKILEEGQTDLIKQSKKQQALLKKKITNVKKKFKELGITKEDIEIFLKY